MIFKAHIAIFLLALGTLSAIGQCSNNNSYWGDLTPTGEGDTQSTSCIYGGKYATVTVCDGATYTFSTCGSSWDTRMTL